MTDEELGTRSNPILRKCSRCGDPTPVEALNADDLCPLCQSLDRLAATMERKGTRHRELFDTKRKEK